MALLLTFILAAATCAGCLGGTGEDEARDREADQEDDKTDDKQDAPQPPFNVGEMNLTMFRFPLEKEVDAVLWKNGTFEPQETGMGGGFATGEFAKEVDLGELVPPQIPTHVEVVVTIDAEHVPFVGPTARALPTDNGTTWYELDWVEPEPGRFEMRGVLKRSEEGRFGVLLEAYVPGHEEPPEVAYSVRAAATAFPDAVPNGVPAAVEFNANETVVFEALGSSRSEVLIYGPDDTLVDRLVIVGQESWRPPTGMRGEFVVLPTYGSGDLRIGTEKGDGALRALGLEREEGPPHAVQPGDTVGWTFDVDERPLRVMLSLVGPDGEPWVCSGPVDLALHSPRDQVLEHSLECPSPTNVPFMFDESWTLGPALGDRSLVAGSYDASVTSDLWYGFEVHHVVERYKR